MSNQQQPQKSGLLSFFRDSVGAQFVIPVYQRNYTWTSNKEVKQYFDDLECILKGKYNQHFLGILIYLINEFNFSSREFSIIDGQQRLTTTFLILYAIKYLMIEKGETEQASQLENQYLTNLFVPDNLKFKLKPLVADDIVYQQIVNDRFNEIENKTSNVYKNYEWIKKQLTFLLKTYSFNDIIMALNKLYVVCIPITKEDSPQKIFESINSTGAKLVASDLIRNYVLMDIESNTQERYYNTYWKEIEKYVTSDSKKLELFFRFFLAAKTKSLSSMSAIYNDFKNWYSNEYEINHVEPEIALKEIVRYAKYYAAIYYKPIKEVDSRIKNSVEEFRNTLSDMPAPLFIELYSMCETLDEEGKPLITYQQFSEIIDLVNCYLIRRAICGLDTSDITRLFPTLLKDILRECNGEYTNIVEYTKKNLINKQRGKAAMMPNDDYMRTYLEFANVYSLRVTLRVIFDKIETFNNPAPVDLSKLSVEHLMPQTPTKEWLDTLKVDETKYEKNLHRLGNLTLATKVDNSKMKNKPWDYKKSILEDTSHLKMNKEILAIPQWTIAEINKRNKKLIEDIITLYPYSSASDDVIVKHDIILDCDDIVSMAILYEEDGSVEVLEGSEIVKYSSNQEVFDWQYDLYSQLLEEGIIKETEKGAVFIKPYLFTPKKAASTSLSESASLILCGSRNGWDYWKDSNGKPLNENKDLKKRLTGK